MPPNSNIVEFSNTMHYILEQLRRQPCYIIGDFHPDLLKVKSSKSFIVTPQIYIQVKQEGEKIHIIHNSAKVYQAM